MSDSPIDGSVERPGLGAHDEWLALASQEWVREGLIKPAQRRRLLAHHGFDTGDERLGGTAGYARAVALVGSVLIGVGVLLVMGANWVGLSHGAKLAFLLGLTAAAYAGGWYLAFDQPRQPLLGRCLVLLGTLFWGTGIFLVGQMYHLGGHGGERTGVLYWLLGALPLAYILRTREHVVLGVALLGTYSVMTIHDVAGWFGQPMLLVVLAFGLLLYQVGMVHRRTRFAALAGPYEALGLGLALLGLYALAFDWHLLWVPEGGAERGLAIAGGCLAAAVAVAAGLAVGHRRDRTSLAECLGLLLAAAWGLIWLAVARQALGDAAHNQVELPWSWAQAIAGNVVLAAAELGLMALAWQRCQPHLIGASLWMIFLHILTRYFDLLGELLPGGLVFIGGGILLILGGLLLERRRRAMLRALRQRG